jgi:hypothetical protein
MRFEQEATPVRVDERMALAPVDLLSSIVTAWPAGLSCLCALGVDDRTRRAGLASDPLPIEHDEGVIDRMERSLYTRGQGYNYEAVKIFMPAGRSKPVYAPYIEHVPPDVTAAIFWLKNRDPAHWRDTQQLEHVMGKYIISDKPMTEEEWARERADVIDVDHQAAFGDGREENHLPAAKRLLDESSPRLPREPTGRKKD